MKMKFVGTGSAFTLKNFQTNTLIERNGKYLLIDAGTDIRFSLHRAGMSYKNIDALYLTHCHGDHISGLEYLAFCTYFDPSCKDDKITLYGNNTLLREAWNHTLSGGLRSVQGKVVTLSDYFDVQMIKKNGGFEWEGIRFHIVQSVHIMDGYSIVHSYGLMIDVPENEGTMTEFKRGKRIFYTGDTQFNPNQIQDFYKAADLIIQDCETTPYMSGVHANYQELCTLSPEIKKKMCLVHFQDNVLDDNGNVLPEWVEKAKKDGFIGFVERGTVMDMTSSVAFPSITSAMVYPLCR
jgi:ribonuclease BN (tRNA processing enzyme)